MIYGLQIPADGFCSEVSHEAFSNGLLIELSGAHADVLKFLPPLVIEEELLEDGLQILDESINKVANGSEAAWEGLDRDDEGVEGLNK